MRTASTQTASSLTARRWASLFFPVAIGVAAMGCAEGRLLPASSAHVIPDAPSAAAAEDSGVRVSAEANDWSGAPEDLSEKLTPIKVRIINRSGGPVQVLYQQFALVGSHGRRYQPLPPAQAGDASAPAVHPVYAASNFFVAPRLHGVYPTLDPWSAPLARDEDFYARQYRRWDDGLPSRPMRRMALPEGVLADRGEISGFLYFENATRKEKRVTFHADMNQPAGDEVAEIEIPFVVR
ncbi:MAG TPA: hypothetical protein VHO67_13050 [Polyangia bacterium]|nr:hypothetical protein [Polyangia bacterium]